MTFENLDRAVNDCFHLPVRFRKLHEFKSIAARQYSSTCIKILEKLIRGPIIHADETKVDLKKGSGYVWVFANMEDRSGSGILHRAISGIPA